MEFTTPTRLWAGRILSGIVILFLLADAIAKLLEVAPVMEGTVKLGYPDNLVFPVGVLLMVGVILYAIPRTSLLGAIYLTGFLGGAFATHFRIGSPLFTHVLFSVYVGLFMWGGLALRNPRLMSLLISRDAPCGRQGQTLQTSLTQSVGLAERSMRALLEQELREAELSFTDWTVLVFTNAAPLDAAEVIRRLLDSHIVPDATDARRAIDRLAAVGLIIRQENQLVQTAKGIAVFSEYGGRAKELSQALYGDLPGPDLEATHRTLTQIAARATRMLKTKGDRS